MDLNAEFARQGLGYVIALMEAGVITWLFYKLDAKDKIVENRDAIINRIQELRISDLKESSSELIKTSTLLLAGQQSLKEVIASQTNAITKILDQLAEGNK